LNIQENISLKPYNTFGIDVNAKRFIAVNSLNELKDVIALNKNIFLLSGGSNMLLTNDIDKLVVHIDFKGIVETKAEDGQILITAQAGENWHEFVLWCISKNYGGLENLSFIPGNVGTSPIQNIGAYGVEIKDTFYHLEALNINSGEIETFSNIACEFGYRNSVFKNKLKGNYIIINVTFKLSTKNHVLNTKYGAITEYLSDFSNPTIEDVSNAVISIRKSKLPDPKEIGNSGSFFKNPVIDLKAFKNLQQKYPNAPHYIVSSTKIKVPAGWLIEQCGFKGKRFGEAGVHAKQALVLVNFGNASGKEIYQLAQDIKQKVKDVFNISLEIEVNVI